MTPRHDNHIKKYIGYAPINKSTDPNIVDNVITYNPNINIRVTAAMTSSQIYHTLINYKYIKYAN